MPPHPFCERSGSSGVDPSGRMHRLHAPPTMPCRSAAVGQGTRGHITGRAIACSSREGRSVGGRTS